MDEKAIDTWAIVDLFGHQQIAGHVSEQVIGSESMLRVDVPAMPGREAFTRFYGVKAIYSLTPVSEEIARQAVESLRERPITVYGLALPAPTITGGLPPHADGFEPEPEYDSDDDEPELHGTCPDCGGEYGDGWTNCTCDEDDIQDADRDK